jgi:hypothetical protein
MESTTTVQNENENGIEEPEPMEQQQQLMEVSQSLFPKRRRRPTLGRAARHRRRKLKELAAAAAAASSSSQQQEEGGGIGRLEQDESNNVWLLSMDGQEEEFKNSTTTTTTTHAVTERIVPTDRQHVWPAVETIRALTVTDQQELIYQLGYLPGNALAIAARGNVLLQSPAQPLSSALKGLTATTIITTARMPLSPTAPIVLKLYPLVLREETNESATKGRNKSRRRRQQQQHLSKSDETLQCDDNPPEDDYVTEGPDPEAATEPVASDNHHPEPLPTSTSPKLIEPFPTIYWVTHPHIKALISQLELQGWGLELERRLALDNSALDSMVRAHASYGLERRALVTQDDLTMIESCHWEEAFSTTRGVAGIRTTAHRRKLKSQPQNEAPPNDNHNHHHQLSPPPPPPPTVAGKIKCLHAHAAHYWSGCHDNRVGQWVAERVTQLLMEQQQQQQLPEKSR